MLVLLSAGIAPGLALLSYFYLRDQYEQEPVITVFKVFLFGAILTFPIMFIQYILSAEGMLQSNFVYSFISAALFEEFFKWFILIFAIYQHADFDEPYDGIVYGASLSLGFATAGKYSLFNYKRHRVSDWTCVISSFQPCLIWGHHGLLSRKGQV